MQIIHKITSTYCIQILPRRSHRSSRKRILSISKKSRFPDKQRSRSWKSVGVDFTVGTCGWTRPKLGEAELAEFSMNCWSGRPSGNERYSSIRRRRRPLSTSATTGSIEFRWITIARGCNGKRTLTSPVVGVLASSIPSSIQLSVVQHSPLVRARTTLVLLGKRSNPLVSPRTKTTSLFFSKPPEP